MLAVARDPSRRIDPAIRLSLLLPHKDKVKVQEKTQPLDKRSQV